MARRQQRVQVGSGINPASLNPVASPVDTFVQTRAGQQLAQLAAGMTKLAPGLAGVAGVLQEQTNERDKAAGIQKARELAESGKSYAAAIKEGLITPDMSPWFRAGLREQYGRVTATKWEEKLIVDMSTDPQMQSTTDLGEVDAFVNKHRAEWLEENLGENDRDEFFEVGWGNMSDALTANFRREMARTISGRIMQQSDDLMHAEVLAGTERSLKDGFDHATIGADLTALSDSKYGLNPKGSDRANRSITDAIVSLARRQNDSSILGILAHVKVGPQGAKTRLTLADTKYAAEAIEQAQNEIGRENDVRYWNQKRLEEQERTERAMNVLGAVGAALEGTSNPHTINLDAFTKEMLEIDPTKVEHIYQIRDAYSNRQYQDNPNVVAEAWARVHTKAPGQAGYFTLADATALLRDQQITPLTYRQLVQEMEQRDAAGGSGAGKFYNDDGLTKGIQRVRRLWVNEMGEFSGEQKMRAELAEFHFTQRYVAWRQGEGANASVTDLNEFIFTTATELMEDIGSEEMQSDLNETVPALGQTRAALEARKPGQPTGPQLPDYRKVGVLTRPAFLAVERSLQAWLQDGGDGPLPPDVESLFRHFRVSAADIPEFLESQRRLAR